jgi:hypothetical protein
MEKLLHRFEERRDERRGVARERMGAFLVLFEQRHREAVIAGPPDFNVLSVCGLTTGEVRHSAIIGWLLDEIGGHGQGRLFFKAFMELCGCDLPDDDMPYKMRTELSGMESIVDVAVFRKRDFLVFLENKTISEEGEDQLNREYRDMQRRGDALGVPDDRRYGVFLTPGGRSPTTGRAEDWRCISYDQLADSVAAILPEVTDTKLTLFLHDWMQTVRLLKE